MRPHFCLMLMFSLASASAVAATPARRTVSQDAPARSALIAVSWVVPPVLAPDTRLPVPEGYVATWTANGKALPGGIVTNRGDQPVTLHLTGRLTAPGAAPVTKSFVIRVLGQDSTDLIAYARIPTDVHDANQPLIARSVHLALGDATGNARPLNGNYGIVFARGQYVGIDRVALRGLIDPSPFYFSDGTLGIIAVRTAMAGAQDMAAASSALIFKSSLADPAGFTELGLVRLADHGGVSRPRAVWDSAARRYVVAWNDEAGKPLWTTVQDLARTQAIASRFDPEHGGPLTRIVAAGNVGRPRPGHVAMGTLDVPAPAIGAEAPAALPVSQTVAAALRNRYGRIVNTGVRVEARTIRAGDLASIRAARALLSYSDGSTATLGIDWDEGDLRALAAARAGRVQIHGKVHQDSYPQILAYNRADPDIYRYVHDGVAKYLFVATDDTDNHNVGSWHLPIRVADSIAGLADANGGKQREVDLLNRRTRGDRTVEGRVIAGCYWAPELHEIGGRLSILFAPCFNPKDDQSHEGGSWDTVEAHIMQMRPGGDPANPADWSKPAAVRKADGSPLGRAGYPGNISLDMSYFEAGGQGYYMWSQRYLTKGALGDPLTWIARVSPSSPTRIIAPPSPIIAPNRGNEENLAEGPFALFHGDRVIIAYSSSSVSPTYLVNGVWAKLGSDLTSIESWHKWNAPLQKSVAMPGGVTDYRLYEQGPGHGSFMQDEDGHTLYIYHTWGDGVGGNGRDTRIRRIHWSFDGRPVLDMTEGEEVAPEKRSVVMDVSISSP